METTKTTADTLRPGDSAMIIREGVEPLPCKVIRWSRLLLQVQIDPAYADSYYRRDSGKYWGESAALRGSRIEPAPAPSVPAGPDKPTRIDWKETGRPYWNDRQAEIQGLCEAIALEPIEKGKAVPFGQGYAIRELIEQFKIRRPLAWGHGPGITEGEDGFYILALEADYPNARIRLFVADDGTGLSPLCVFAWDKPPQPETRPYQFGDIFRDVEGGYEPWNLPEGMPADSRQFVGCGPTPEAAGRAALDLAEFFGHDVSRIPNPYAGELIPAPEGLLCFTELWLGGEFAGPDSVCPPSHTATKEATSCN